MPVGDFSRADIVRMLVIAKDIPCPGNPGCRCHACYGNPPNVLRIQTLGKTTAPEIPACSGTMTCACPDCTEDRARAVAIGSRDRAQPWQTRRAA